jgi:predicted outer membrane repeat protein
MRTREWIALAIVGLILAGGSARAIVINVPGDALTIQAGIEAAGIDDVVQIAAGTWYEHDLVLKPRITVRSTSGDPGAVVIDAQGLGRVFSATSCVNTRLEGLVIRGGNVEAGGNWGGGILTTLSPLTIERCIFVGNTADQGGAIAASTGSSLTVIDCVVSGNVATTAGGGLLIWNSNVTVEGCTFSANTAPAGSGIHASGSAYPVLDRVLVVNGLVGEAVFFANDSIGTIDACDFFGHAGGDWAGNVFSFFFQLDNIQADPQFCSSIPDDQLAWGIQSDSPCAPAQTGGYLIGAGGVTCATTATRQATWGEVKALYR